MQCRREEREWRCEVGLKTGKQTPKNRHAQAIFDSDSYFWGLHFEQQYEQQEQSGFEDASWHGGQRRAGDDVGVGAGLSAGAKRANATPGGLSNYASTDIYTKHNYHFDADTFTSTNGDSLGTSLGLTYGLGPEKDGAFGRSEIGFD